MAKSIRDVLEEFREHSLDERAKGALFEQLMRDFLKTDTQYERLFDEVWLWSEYPERGNRADTGIDLVARERDTGELVAIQCKFYAPQTLISKPDIDSFLASSSKAEFKGRMFISTSDNWGKNAEEAIAGQRPEAARLGLTDLDESSIDWSKFSFQTPQKLEKKARKSPRPHQEEAIQSVLKGFEEADRGKLIMACGTGKTFTSLKLVEKMFPNGGTVLFLVPSISLLSQALKEWTIEAETPLRSYAVCSDVSVGKRKNDEDLPVTDLAFPATTNTERLVEKFTEAGPNQNGLTVIFSTYQSIDVVAQAQSRGIPEFDLIVCDEAHRTTGVTLSGDDESAFVKVHNQDFIKGKKRLYMTATPKVFSDASSKKAEEAGAILADMGKPDMFGEEFHRLGFGEAVERGILTDYKVLVLAVDEAYVARRFQRQFADDDNELKLEDAAKIVGCWNGLSKRSTEQEEFQIDPGSMKRAVAFARSIAESKKIASMFQAVVDEETAQLDNDEAEYLRCEVEHVDGSFNSLRRNEKLDWLRQEVPENTARILSNARCLTEGVDVPALDAVMFLNPRDSQVDVVQAVGRVMRKLEGKKYGYVVLPIGVPANMDPATALNDNKKYKVVWQVLQALRSHDERFDAMVNKIDLTKKAPQIGIIGVGGGADGNGKDENGSVTLDFPNFDQWRDAILAKIVNKVGDKHYLDTWARDVSEIASRQIIRIRTLVGSSQSGLLEKFDRFLKGLQDNLNPQIDADDAIEMLAQHMITKPIFDALFEDYEFSIRNPVSLVMEEMVGALQANNLEDEQEKLESFYKSVQLRVSGIQDAQSRQKVVKQLYEEFFRTAFKSSSDRLGIVYTPVEIVDFIIHSTEFVMKEHFSSSLSAQGVHILDPFTGTGTFPARLLESGLIPREDIARKYANELHANELVLLAYYVAAVNIESVFHGLTGSEYQVFEGIVLTDSFQMYEDDDELDGGDVFPENNSRVKKQKEAPIRVVIGNPPYSVGQGSENDNQKNIRYPDLDEAVRSTFAARSSSGLKRNLYDSYVRSIRWSADRIGDRGVVSFVINGSFLESSAFDGLRLSLQEEFDAIYIVNLRGNSRSPNSAAEGGNVFDVRVGIAVLILVRTSPATERLEQAVIKYFDIGTELSKEQKLAQLDTLSSISGIRFEHLSPSPEGDWLGARDQQYGRFIPLISRDNSESLTVFSDGSYGMVTGRDSWVYGSSPEKVLDNVGNMINFRNKEAEKLWGLSKDQIDRQLDNDPTSISWTRSMKAGLRKKKTLGFRPESLAMAEYRPFFPQFLYTDAPMIEVSYRIPQLFRGEEGNTGFYVTGVGSPKPFSVFAVGRRPDMAFWGSAAGYFFPRKQANSSYGEDGAFSFDSLGGAGSTITPEAKKVFEGALGKEVSEDELFTYTYGVLYSPEYRDLFRFDLTRDMPRLPVSKHFDDFARIGRELFDIHLNYLDVTPYPLELEWVGPETFQIQKMKLIADKVPDCVAVSVNSSLTVRGIPKRALDFQLAGKSALKWVIDRYQVRRDPKSGIINDPNDLAAVFEDEQFIVALIARVVALSVRTLDIVASMPPLQAIEAEEK